MRFVSKLVYVLVCWNLVRIEIDSVFAGECLSWDGLLRALIKGVALV